MGKSRCGKMSGSGVYCTLEEWNWVTGWHQSCFFRWIVCGSLESAARHWQVRAMKELLDRDHSWGGGGKTK
eukprot:190587-Amphidinium_carterae.1